MKKSLLTFCVFISVSWGAVAQIDPLYAQYLNNPLLINPAYSGFQHNLSASTSFRKQWAGFDGSPVTINVNAHTSLNDNRMGAGLIIVQDKIGSNKNTEVQATYAYKLDLNKKFFSFGLQAGVLNFKSTNSDLNIYDPNDPAFFGSLNTTKPSFGAGAILHSDRFFLGLSVPRLLNTQTVYNNAETQLYNRHFYAMGSYIIFINEHIRLKPSVLLKGVKGAKLSTDLNFALNIDEKYTAGVFSRNFNTYGFQGQMKLGDKYRFGYVFEVPTNKSVGSRFTSHEVTLGVNLAIFNFHDSMSVSTF